MGLNLGKNLCSRGPFGPSLCSVLINHLIELYTCKASYFNFLFKSLLLYCFTALL